MMNTTIKNYLGSVGIIALLALSYAGIRAANNIENPPVRTFFVQGEGEVIAIPDVARFTFTILTEGGADLPTLQEANTKKASAAINYLKKNSVEKKDIKTAGYSVSPRYQYYDCGRYVGTRGAIEPCPPAEIVGYTISQSVQVTVRDLESAGLLLSGVVENGANTVSGISFEIDDETEFKNEARAEAFDDAKEKARAIAGAAGFRIGKIVSINENFYTPQVFGRTFALDAVGGEGAAPAPAIEPGSQEVKVTVNVEYEIK